MAEYLGEKIVDESTTPYAGSTAADWALRFMFMYGQIDGAHHKQWVLDQAARILHGTPVIIKKASWSDGTTEYRFETGAPSLRYLQWVETYRGDFIDGEYEYSYDEGIAP